MQLNFFFLWIEPGASPFVFGLFHGFKTHKKGLTMNNDVFDPDCFLAWVQANYPRDYLKIYQMILDFEAFADSDDDDLRIDD